MDFCTVSANSSSTAKAAGVARIEKEEEDDPGVVKSDNNDWVGVLLEEVDIFWKRIDCHDLLLRDFRGSPNGRRSSRMVGRCEKVLCICHCGRMFLW